MREGACDIYMRGESSRPPFFWLFSGLQPKYGSGHWIASLIPDPDLASSKSGHYMRKFVSLVISASMVSSVIMPLCNHVRSLYSAYFIKIPHMSSTNPLIISPQIPQIPQSSADPADYSAVCAGSVQNGQTCIVISC